MKFSDERRETEKGNLGYNSAGTQNQITKEENKEEKKPSRNISNSLNIKQDQLLADRCAQFAVNFVFRDLVIIH